MSGSVTVEGADQLTRTLGRAGDDVAALTGTNDQVARIIAGRAAATAPRVSGRLGAAVAGFGTTTEAVVNANVPYAGPIHFGWAARHIAPQPFITRARETTRPQWQRLYDEQLQHVCNEVKGK